MMSVVLHFENDQTPYVYRIDLKKWNRSASYPGDLLMIPIREIKDELDIYNNYRFFVSSQDIHLGSVRKEVRDSDVLKVHPGIRAEFWLIKNIVRSPENSSCMVMSPPINENVHVPPRSLCGSSIATGHSWSNMINRSRSVCYSAVSSPDVQIVQVQLRMSPYVPVGLSFSGRVDLDGFDQGVFVDSVLPGTTAHIEGQCSPGMLLLEVNGRSLEKSSNSEAMRTIEEALGREKRIVDLVLARFDSPAALNSLVKDPSSHSAGHCSDSGTLVTTSADSVAPNLSINTDLFTIMANMLKSPKSLPIRDRNWLKVKISDAFLGTDLINWLQANVDGIGRRKDALLYAQTMIEAGFIVDSILGSKKRGFFPQRYYGISPGILTRLREVSGAVSLFSNTLASDRR